MATHPRATPCLALRELLPAFNTAESYSRSSAPPRATHLRATPGLQHRRERLPVGFAGFFLAVSRSPTNPTHTTTAKRATPGLQHRRELPPVGFAGLFFSFRADMHCIAHCVERARTAAIKPNRPQSKDLRAAAHNDSNYWTARIKGSEGRGTQRLNSLMQRCLKAFA